MATQETLVTFLLDRSGSMNQVLEDTIGGFNAYLDGLKEGDQGEVKFTFLQFDSFGVDKICVSEPIANVKKLDKNTYVPRGNTPLIDACVKTVNAVDEVLKGKPADGEANGDRLQRVAEEISAKPAPKVVIVFHTDGQENASEEYVWSDLQALVKEKIGIGWEFLFMGASIDAYDQGAKMGIQRGSTVSYNAGSTIGTQAAFAASARNTRSFVSGRSANAGYSVEDKLAAGDAFDPDVKAAVSGGIASAQSPWAPPAGATPVMTVAPAPAPALNPTPKPKKPKKAVVYKITL